MQFRTARNKVKWQFLVLNPVSRQVLLKFYLYLCSKYKKLSHWMSRYICWKERIAKLKTYKHNSLEMWQCTDSSFITSNAIHSTMITHRKPFLILWIKAPINSFHSETFIEKRNSERVLHRFFRNRVFCDNLFSSFVKRNRSNSWSLTVNMKSYCKYFMSYWRSMTRSMDMGNTKKFLWLLSCSRTTW